MEKEQIIEGLEWKRRIATQIGTVAFVEGEIGALCDLIRELTEENERLREKADGLRELNAMLTETGQEWQKRYESLAREIFAEIEKYLIFNHYDISTISAKTFAELKQKYGVK